MSLIRTLLKLAVHGGGNDESLRRALAAVNADDWPDLIELLEHHRLVPLVCWRLEQAGLLDAVPAEAAGAMRERYRSVLLTNTVLLHALGRVLGALHERDVEPTVWKGVVLADSFYPDLGTRRMVDVDFDIPREQMDAATEGFASVGLTPRDDLSTDDAVYFSNPAGVLFDVHHRVRLFEDKQHLGLTTDITPQRIKAPHMRVLEPNAFLMHLCVHLEGHRPERGYMLTWLIDVAFVLQHWGAQLEWSRLEQLAPTPGAMQGIARTLSFLRDELFVTMPETIAGRVRGSTGPTLLEVLRSRRTEPWGLPGLRGWARVVLCRLGLREIPEEYVLPQLGDLFHLPGDVARRRSAQRAAMM